LIDDDDDPTTSASPTPDNFYLLYPNPSCGPATLFIDESHLPARCIVLDIDGKVVAEKLITASETELDEGLPSGVYRLNLISNHDRTTLKWVVIR
jgi:hypothetical protein